MKCSKDQTEMLKGFLLQGGQKWHEGNIINNFLSKFFAWKAKIVVAYKCPNCKKIELFAEEV